MTAARGARAQRRVADVADQTDQADQADLRRLLAWLSTPPADAALARRCAVLTSTAAPRVDVILPGPTGERNTYTLVPRTCVLCLGETRVELLRQFAVVLAAGSHAAWLAGPVGEAFVQELPAPLRRRASLVAEPALDRFDAALIDAADPARVAAWSRRLAERDGPIVALHVVPSQADRPFELERLQVERTLSVNTAAAGGNASLMTIG